MFQDEPPRGFWWDQGLVDVLRVRFRQTAIYLKLVRPVEHLIVSEEEIHEDEG